MLDMFTKPGLGYIGYNLYRRTKGVKYKIYIIK